MKYLYLLFCLLSLPLYGQSYHFASINFLIEQEVGRIVITEVYKRLGINITITPLPGKRAQHETAVGLNDGEIMRIYSYGEETPSTIRVPTSYYYLETMVFSKKGSGVNIKTSADLARYQVVKVRGVKHTDNITKGLKNITDTDNTSQMFKLIQAGLADIALTNKMDGLVVLKKLGITDITPQTQHLDKLPLYHYIRKEHINLIKRVDNKLKEMKKSGELAKLITIAEHEVFKRKALYKMQN
ncbi:hypothetical protein PSECIP111951_02641 [Pseudoalteromonas holothuriae]|uniref:Solute-binding protein family 3/N-terminal domain-containing protein n=1 Tax=Pseudoalteromonas holothuriae TaxID=2963714 RepID=A0ABM9GKC5_9GAMM|nr:transporter substrate-binding domain-containing protein [Pseudoalteromonas sp. CIP111951]CAH9062185.1 hypothetical protein PSECIP111951_02641 [Pseudoalteromonas sp. CIP111951]